MDSGPGLVQGIHPGLSQRMHAAPGAPDRLEPGGLRGPAGLHGNVRGESTEVTTAREHGTAPDGVQARTRGHAPDGRAALRAVAGGGDRHVVRDGHNGPGRRSGGVEGRPLRPVREARQVRGRAEGPVGAGIRPQARDSTFPVGRGPPRTAPSGGDKFDSERTGPGTAAAGPAGPGRPYSRAPTAAASAAPTSTCWTRNTSCRWHGTDVRWACWATRARNAWATGGPTAGSACGRPPLDMPRPSPPAWACSTRGPSRARTLSGCIRTSGKDTISPGAGPAVSSGPTW